MNKQHPSPCDYNGYWLYLSILPNFYKKMSEVTPDKFDYFRCVLLPKLKPTFSRAYLAGQYFTEDKNVIEINITGLKPEQLSAVDDLIAKFLEENNPTVWEPKGGGWWVTNAGMVCESGSCVRERLVGIESDTKEGAQRIADLRVTREIINDLIRQLNNGWVPNYDDGKQKYFVTYNEKTGRFDERGYYNTSIPGSEAVNPECVSTVLNMLNNGLVRGIGDAK